jgi:tetratricopeptide (TPR) repeat protein
MILIKLVIGVVFLLLGWIYLYNPNIILYINRFVRDTLFNDRSVLLQRKKLSILFFCLSLLALYMGATSLLHKSAAVGSEQWTAERNQFLLYSAAQDYYSKKYTSALEKYGKILESDPGNMEALEQLGAVYRASGDTANAKSVWYRLLQLNPGNKRVLDNLRKIEKESLQRKAR